MVHLGWFKTGIKLIPKHFSLSFQVFASDFLLDKQDQDEQEALMSFVEHSSFDMKEDIE